MSKRKKAAVPALPQVRVRQRLTQEELDAIQDRKDDEADALIRARGEALAKVAPWMGTPMRLVEFPKPHTYTLAFHLGWMGDLHFAGEVDEVDDLFLIEQVGITPQQVRLIRSAIAKLKEPEVQPVAEPEPA